MQDKENGEADFGDDLYDDLDDNFEEDFDAADFDDLDLELDDDLGDEDINTDDLDLDDLTIEPQEQDVPAMGAQVEKRKIVNMSFNAMMITGALVVGVGVLGFQVISKKPTGSVERFVSSLRMNGASDGPVFGKNQEEIVSTEIDSTNTDASGARDEGFLYNPESLDEIHQDLKDTPPMPATITPEQPALSTNEELPEVIIDEPAIQVAEQQVPRAPDDGAPTTPMADITDTTDFFDSLKPAPTAPEVKPEEEQKQPAIPEVNKAAEAIEKARAKKEAKQSAPQKTEAPEVVTAAPVTPSQPEITAPNPSVATPSDQPVPVAAIDPDLEKKINMIVERLDDIDMKITQVRETGDSKIEGINDALDDLKKDFTQLEKTPPAKTVQSASVSDSKPTPVKKAAAPAKKKTAVVTWELRAAQPGKAWVSKKGQKDIQPVVVGNMLAGIGQVTAITYSGGKWVVQGTNGSIRQ